MLKNAVINFGRDVSMKTVLYRIQSIETPEGEGFRYNSLRTLSDTKVNEKMCLRNEFGDHYLINDPDY